jgi:predicted nucleotidyltransferase
MFPVAIQQDQLAEFCRHNGIRCLAVFGSALTDRFSPSSDLDLLVEFESDQRVGMLRMASLERELSYFFDGRKVDPLATQSLRP